MKKITIIFILVLTLVSMSGCATSIVLLEGRTNYPKIYPSTLFNCNSIYFLSNWELEALINASFIDVGFCPLLIVGNTIDLPISIVSDTLFLPLDVYRWNFPKNKIEPIKIQKQEELKTNHLKNQKS